MKTEVLIVTGEQNQREDFLDISAANTSETDKEIEIDEEGISR